MKICIIDIEKEKENIYITGRTSIGSIKGRWICENIDDVYDIRFAIDWLEIIEIGNDDFEINIGDRVSFSVKYDSIEVYPYSM